jgi:UDP-N-acetylmuramoyl-tripeptide--D-alanyl-D-alanine ligase
MQKLAREVRRRWGRRVIGVTGSAGKTTTKEVVAQVLSARFKVLKSAGNLNNHFGVPLQLLRLESEHEVAVIEMGMNHAGEIRALAKIAEPDWAVVSNVAPVHLEHFADGIEGIARAKYELVESLPADGIAILNADDERVAAMGRGLGERAVLYGFGANAAVRGVEVHEAGVAGMEFAVEARGARADVKLALMGRHNVLNALAGIAVGVQSGMDLEECARAIAGLQPSDKRGQVMQWHGATIINDCYNSNPRALEAMVSALAAVPARRRVVVAGEMLELGPEGPALHAASGEALAGMGVDVVVGVRGLASALVEAARAAGVEAVFVGSPEDAGLWMREHLREGDAVLVKGSRGVGLERGLKLLG